MILLCLVLNDEKDKTHTTTNLNYVVVIETFPTMLRGLYTSCAKTVTPCARCLYYTNDYERSTTRLLNYSIVQEMV